MSLEDCEVVISGIGCRFPECNNVAEFKEKLFDKTNFLKTDLKRWRPACGLEKPLLCGRIPDWNKFDASLFGIHPKLVRNCDPMMGLMLETTFEAIIDAGMNPFLLKGHNISVSSIPSMSDAEILRTSEGIFLEGWGMVGHSRTMMANRISYFFNFTGPSFSYDSSWASTVQAIKRAATLVAQGASESAVVSVVNLISCSTFDECYRSLGLLSQDSCHPFDDRAHGFARSEAVVTFFIQRAQDVKRHYCTLVKTSATYMGDRSSNFFCPWLGTFLQNFYHDCSVDPEKVAYIEAHGVCSKEFDAVELNAVADVFLPSSSSKESLLIGSVSGNVGNSETGTVALSLVKAIIALEGSVIPPTINYQNPNQQVPALLSGHLKPVLEPTPLDGDYIGMNILYFNSSVGHMLVGRHDKTKKPLCVGDLPEDKLPRLVVLQARHEEGAKAITDKICSMPTDAEYISMVNDVFKTPIPSYLWRAYTIVPTTKEKIAYNVEQRNDSSKRPLWFVFSGMGSQWSKMGEELLQIPIFASAISKCDRVLRPHGVDIKSILTSPDPEIFNSVVNCFVGIAAVQIGLLDILRALGVSPDGMIGHSVGELGCAYADGCFSAEEMILAAYVRGRASIEADSNLTKGMMAAVGMGYNDIKDKLPESIDVACHNSSDSCTLSGPTDEVIQYVEKLKKDGVFAKAVSAGGIAYHSRYIKTVAPKLLKYLKEAVPNPKPRSDRWISSSVPESQWQTPEAKLCSPEYHTNNLLSPVLFEEACKHLPKNAIVLEIAPHALLQAILRRSLGSEVTNIPITNKNAASSINHLLNAIGQLYLNNVDIDVNALYPPVHYPVARNTPSLVDLITYDHGEDCYQLLSSLIQMFFNLGLSEQEIEISPLSTEYLLWKEHRIDEAVVVPISQILIYPWKMILDLKRLQLEEQSVIIEDLSITDHLTVHEIEKTIMITFSPANLEFEVALCCPEDDFVTFNNFVTGKLSQVSDLAIRVPDFPADTSEMEEITEAEIYFTFSKFGCHLGPKFQNIKQILIGETECVAKVQWRGDLVLFLEALFKIIILIKSEEQQQLLEPVSFIKLAVNVPFLFSLAKDTEVVLLYDYWCNRLVCEGVELLGLTLRPVAFNKPLCLAWRELKFQPYYDTKLSLNEFLSASIQLVADSNLSSWNQKTSSLKVLIIKDEHRRQTECNFSRLLKQDIRWQPNISLKIIETRFTKALDLLAASQQQTYLVVGDYNKLVALMDTQESVYFLTYVSNNGTPKHSHTLRPVLVHKSESGKIVLLKKLSTQRKFKVFNLEGNGWLGSLNQLVKDNTDHPVIVVSRSLTPRQVLPVLAKESFARRLRTFFIQDNDAPQFSITSPFYAAQLSLGLSINILAGGHWGSLCSLGLNITPIKTNLQCLLRSSNKNVNVSCVGLNTTAYTIYEDIEVDEPKVKHVDFSGFQGGERIMGVGQFDSVSNCLAPDSALTWNVPSSWSMEDAATVPVIFSLAYYCIHLKAKVEAGEKLLIHAGMSPVGQAMVAVALQTGAEVFVTVKDDDEILSLLKIFPSLKPNHVMLLGDEEINVGVRKMTAGKGVEVIINCLRGKDMQSSIKLMDYDCRFLHLGHIRVEDKESVGMLTFLKRTAFCGVTLNNVANCSEEGKAQLYELLQRGIEQGAVTPLNRRLFSVKQQTEALKHLTTMKAEEKTILSTLQEGKILSNVKEFHFSPNQLNIIAGPRAEMWLEVAEWLVKQGVRKLIILTEEETQDNNYIRRLNNLIYRFKCTTVVTSSSRIDSSEGAFEFFKEILHIGNIYSIFCICMDESSEIMRNLDKASRELVPGLQQFVSLLGDGYGVCESRALSNLPVYSIQSESPLVSPTKVLPYLSALLTDASSKSRFFVVGDSISTTEITEALDDLSFLPSSVEELAAIGELVETTPRFIEEVTRSPRYHSARHPLLPVFIIPGLGSERLQPLIEQLINPAFCCSVPATIKSVEHFAQCLVQDIEKIQRKGPYNIVGESWNGAVALELGHLLEGRGHQVELFLLDGVPTTSQDRLRALCDGNMSDLGSSLLLATTNLPIEVEKVTFQELRWADKLEMFLRLVEVEKRASVSAALTSMLSQFTALLNHKPSHQLFKGRATVIQNKPLSSAETNGLAQFCHLRPNEVIVDDGNFRGLIASHKTATTINEKVAFDWSQ